MKVESFDFEPGMRVSARYEIIDLIGQGYEGEVYLVRELQTGIERAAKFFYPQRNVHNRAAKFYARKMHKLRNCDIMIQYILQDTIFIEGVAVTYMISEYIEGELLSSFLKRQPGGRLHPFAALHLLYALASGIVDVHSLNEYHGDLHSDNIIVLRSGLSFELKVLDPYKWGSSSAQHVYDDVVDLINIFYEVLGGQKHYASLPKEVKDVCCGLKRSLILKKFKTAGKLRSYLDNLEWE
jgi:serine/threonine protein kinase